MTEYWKKIRDANNHLENQVPTEAKEYSTDYLHLIKPLHENQRAVVQLVKELSHSKSNSLIYVSQ